jgi:glycosyltransferase involved in cell wall biosynthesis
VVATGGQHRGQRRDEISGALIEEFDIQGADWWLNPIRGDTAGYVRFLVESDFDVVIMNAWQTWSTDLCLRSLGQINGRKILYSHCVSTNLLFRHQPIRSLIRYLLWRPYWWRLPAILLRLDGLIFLAHDGCDSRFDDLKLAQELGLPFHVVPNALPPAALEVLAHPVVARESRQQLIAIGSYNWQKGHDFVLRAYARSGAKNRIPLKLCGQTFSTYTADLRRLALELGIESEYLGFHEGLQGAALLEECQNSALLISGSHTECQPLVLLDAMATGTPFVARATGCISSLPGGVAVNNETEAARTMDRLLADDGEWTCRSAAGRAEVSARNHPTTIAGQLMAALAMQNSRS